MQNMFRDFPEFFGICECVYAKYLLGFFGIFPRLLRNLWMHYIIIYMFRDSFGIFSGSREFSIPIPGISGFLKKKIPGIGILKIPGISGSGSGSRKNPIPKPPLVMTFVDLKTPIFKIFWKMLDTTGEIWKTWELTFPQISLSFLFNGHSRANWYF